MGLLPPVARVVAGAAWLDGQEVLRLDEAKLRRLRGGAMAMIFQDPLSSLNPVHRIGSQIAEAVLAHQTTSAAAAWKQAVGLLKRVGIPDPPRRARAFPHEMSGGMRQRAMIAMAIANNPRLLIADEPTTALDVTIQAQVLELLADLKRERGMALIFITHSLPVVAEIADRVAVMYAGEVVEQGRADEVFARPLHPYTAALLRSAPKEDGTLPVGIPGIVPPPGALPPGCVFAPRCPHRRPACEAAPPPLEKAGGGRLTRCIRWREVSMTALVRAEGLSKWFPSRGLFGRGRAVQAVTDVNLSIGQHEAVGLVGESGSGKSTIGRLLLGLIPPSAGHIILDGVDLVETNAATLRRLRRRMQIVFQDPYSSLDPRRKVRPSSRGRPRDPPL